MKRILIGFLVLVGGCIAALCVVAWRFEARIQPNTYVGPVNVGGLEAPEAAKRLREWWEGKKRVPLKVACEAIKQALPEMTASQLGVRIDDAGTIAALPTQDFVGAATSLVSKSGDSAKFAVKYQPNGESLQSLESLLKKAVGSGKPARASFVKDHIEREPEVTALQLKKSDLVQEVGRAVEGDLVVHLPVEQAPKHVPDDQLAQISEVVQAFTTHFPTHMTSRNSNIKLASGKLNGIVLMPGERVSFNETVGRRTIEAGFKEAGVFKNGKHDHGIGGGICQVSSTLYNAALFSDLGIRSRHNHSMPVPYLPVGRDATVDYGSIDLVLENTYPTPIAISSEFKNGSLTFRVLGKKDPSLSVKVITEGHKSWDRGMKVSQDKSLKPGKFKVVDKGSAGHSIYSYRLVYHDGKLTKREPLGRSFYPGAPKLIACNGPYPPAKVAPAPAAQLPAPPKSR